MKNKVAKILFFIISIILVVNKFNTYAKENNDNSTNVEKIYIENNSVDLEINDNVGVISIKNEHFYKNFNFSIYYLEESAFAYNTLILDYI
jgi:hypothetical protein